MKGTRHLISVALFLMMLMNCIVSQRLLAQETPLTEEEQTWLALKHTVRVRLTEQAPYLYSENGKPVGIAVDFLNTISERTGINFQFTTGSVPFAAAVEGLIEHTGPDVISTLNPTPEREETILFTEVFFSSPKFIFTRDDAPFIAGVDGLVGRTVAAIEGYVTYQYLAKEHPGINLLLYENSEDALRAVSSGKAFAFIGSLLATSTMISGFGLTNLRASAPSSLPDATLSMGIRNDWPELRDIINKVIDSTPADVKTAIINKWSTVRVEHGIKPFDILKWVFVAIGIIVLTIIVFVAWNNTLRRKVSERTAELQGSEQRFRAFMEQSPVSIQIHDRDGKLIHSNSAYTKLFALSQENLTDLYEKYNVRSDEQAKAKGLQTFIERVYAGEDVVFPPYEYDGTATLKTLGLKTPESRKCWVQTRAFPVKDGNGTVLRAVFMSEDITDKRKAEEERERILSLSRDLICIAGMDGYFKYLNPAWERTLGYSTDELLSRPYLDFIHPDDHSRNDQEVEKLSSGEPTTDFENQYICKDGSIRFIHWKATPLLGEMQIYCIGRDITERKKAENALRASETRFSNIFRTSPLATALSRMEGGQLVEVNPAWQKITGYTYDEAIGKTVNDLNLYVRPEQRSHIIREMQKHGKVSDFELQLQKKSGEIIDLLFSAELIELAGESLMLSMALDITERKLAEERYKVFFQENININYWIEMKTPIPINLPVDEQVEAIFREGYIKDVNDSMAKVFGLETKENLLGEPLKSIYNPKELLPGSEIYKIYHDFVCAGYKLIQRESSEPSVSGKLNWFLNNAIGVFEDEYLLRIWGSLIDITNRKIAEQKLENSEAKYRALYNNALVGLFRTSLESGRVIEANQASANLFGYASIDEFIEEFEAINHYVNLEDREPVIKMLREKGFVNKIEIHSKKKGGTEIWNEASFRSNVEQGFVECVAIDITARKNAEDEIQRALEEIKELKNRIEAENVYLRDEISQSSQLHGIVVESNAMKKVLSRIEQVAPTDSTVLVLGETGTGKELVARAIHTAGSRKEASLITVNCAAMPTALVESELFGSEKGAYTGALSRQIGRFEAANGGTIFLDEIGELSPETQAKLLRVLQDGRFERLGSSKTISVDVRIIAATNRDLGQFVSDGGFRADLYYRLNIFPIHIPPLREHQEDIPSLVWMFVREFERRMGKIVESIRQETMNDLQRYSWPGNVRELRNVVERAMILSIGPTLSIPIPDVGTPADQHLISLDEAQRQHILQVLEATGWRVKGPNGAAEILGINPSTLRSRIKKLRIQHPD